MSRKEIKPVAAVITAAGLSSRMGTLKALLPLGEGSILSACVENMRRAGAEITVVVTGHRAEEIEAHLAGSGCVTVHNPDYAKNHMFDSLCIGLRALGEDYGRVLVSPVDVPAVKADTVLRLLETEGDFVRPIFEGRPGHPVLLSAGIIGDILAYGGEGGLRGAMDALNIKPTDVETDDEGVSVDADTPEDYAKILKIMETR